MKSSGQKPWYQQSPIKIRRESTYYAPELPPLVFNYPTVEGTLDNHNFVLVRGSDAHCKFEGMTCPLIRVHFHAPSEHIVDGRRADLEVHLVHEIPEYPEGYPSAYLVVGVMAGLKPATVLAGAPALPLDAWLRRRLTARAGAGLPATGDTQPPTPTPTGPLSLSLQDFLPKDLAYYRYEGSLTTAPFDELVSWVVLRDAETLDDERSLQVEQDTLYGIRLVQSRDRRFVLRSFEAPPST